MKKLNLYSKSNIERNHLIDTLRGVNNISLIIYISMMVFFLIAIMFESIFSNSFTRFDFLPTGVIDNNITRYPDQVPMYTFSMLRTEPLATFIIASVVAFLQFGFVFNKKAAFAQLRSGIDRNRIYLNKTLFPLLLVLVGITSIKLIPLCININVLGSVEGLLIPFIANLMQSLLGAVLGYTCTIAGCLFTARIIECVAFIFGAAALPYCLFEAINKALHMTLKGYDGDYSFAEGKNELTYYLRYFDPALGCNGQFDNFAEGWLSNPTTEEKAIILVDIIWFIVFAIVLAILGRYFKRHFKAEDVRKKAKTPMAVTIPCLTASLFAFIMIYEMNGTYCGTVRLHDNIIQNIALDLAAAFAVAAVASLIITLKPKKVVWAFLSFAICGVVVVASALSGASGCLGLKDTIPPAEEIDSVSISTPINMFDYKHNEYFHPHSTNVEYIAFESKNDIEIIRNIHKAFIEDDKKDTGAYCDIVYALKNGRIIRREYTFIGTDGVDAALSLWDTEVAKHRYGNLFDMVSSTETDEQFYLPETNPKRLNNVSIISKYNVVTSISETMTLKGKQALATALHKDIKSLSAKDWFYPEEQYGVLAISSDYPLMPNSPLDEFEGNENGQFYIAINSKMTNTIAILEKYHYMQYFDKKKPISASYLVESDDLTSWYRDFTKESFKPTTPDGKPVHLTYITWNNICFDAFVKCSFKGGVDQERLKCNPTFNTTYNNVVNGQVNSDAQFPEFTKVEPEKAAQLIENAYLSYNAGNKCSFLVTIYTDGTYNTVIIPDNK